MVVEVRFKPKVWNCRSCRARCVWMVTTRGKMILAELDTVKNAEVQLDIEGVPVFNQKAGHVAHFANCPDAQFWRRDGRDQST